MDDYYDEFLHVIVDDIDSMSIPYFKLSPATCFYSNLFIYNFISWGPKLV